MTPDLPADSPGEPVIQPPFTMGMMTKVVKGSIWTLAGQVAPLFATIIGTPFTIRLLGSEGYGVLVLVGLIPLYLSFADLGMGVASTRFGSMAFSDNDHARESSVVWTAAATATITAIIFTAPIFIFAGNIVLLLNVPEHFHAEGTIALRIASVTFIVTVLSNVFNTPQLSRLRMDLNSLIGGGSRVLIALFVPIVVYLGGGIAGATLVGLVVSVLSLACHLFVSGRLLPELWNIRFDTQRSLEMVRFGLGLLASGVATIFLANFEKLALTKLVAVESLAFYSIAFTFASMTTLYSIAMIQSLVPAFSQLLGEHKKENFRALYRWTLKFNILVVLPSVTALFVIAQPFFYFWAGESFGRESTPAFHILLGGLVFNLVAYVPHGAITAHGRTDVLAKLYWIETILYVGLVIALVARWGINGAALAWSIRVAADAAAIILLARRLTGVSSGLWALMNLRTLPIIAVLILPIVYTMLWGSYSAWPFVILTASIVSYLILVWKQLLTTAERKHALEFIGGFGPMNRIAKV